MDGNKVSLSPQDEWVLLISPGPVHIVPITHLFHLFPRESGSTKAGSGF
jgi:hypothetical protein